MMLGEGLLNKQIAFKLGVSEATIKAHVSAILQKLGVDSRTQAVIAINRIGTTGDWPARRTERAVWRLGVRPSASAGNRGRCSPGSDPAALTPWRSLSRASP